MCNAPLSEEVKINLRQDNVDGTANKGQNRLSGYCDLPAFTVRQTGLIN